MKKEILSESAKIRIQELAGIIQENAQKIMKLGFNEPIAKFLADIDKKRGLYFADKLTREFAELRGMENAENENLKLLLKDINQEELLDFLKDKEDEIKKVSQWIKDSKGAINIKDFATFQDALEASNTTPKKEEDVVFDSDVMMFLKGIEFDIAEELGILSLKSFASNKLEERGINSTNVNVKELINTIDQKEFLEFLKRNENSLVLISEWVDSPLRQETDGGIVGKEKAMFLKNKNFKNLEDALAFANAWHTNLTASGVIRDHSIGRIIERYPDGYYWKDLDTNKSPDEGQAMGHCGTDLKATTLLSLRDKNDEPHVTMAYDEDNKLIRQVKGKENKKPIEKYMKYVNDLLKKLVKEGKLVGFKWSYPLYGTDLNDAEVKDILKTSPRLYFMYLKKRVQQSASNLGVRY